MHEDRAPGVLITAIKGFKMELELGINIIFLEGKLDSGFSFLLLFLHLQLHPSEIQT